MVRSGPALRPVAMPPAPVEVAPALERALLRWLIRRARVEIGELAARGGCTRSAIARFFAGSVTIDVRPIRAAIDDALIGDVLRTAIATDLGCARELVGSLRDELASRLPVLVGHAGVRDPLVRVGLHALAREAGVRWGAYRRLVRAGPIAPELARVLLEHRPAGARVRGRAGDVFEHVIRTKMRAAGVPTVDALARASGHCRRAVDGWLRGHRPISATALARVCAALTRDDDPRAAATFRLAARAAAAVQDFQLRSGLSYTMVRTVLLRMVEAARSVEARTLSRPQAIELLLHGARPADTVVPHARAS